MKITVRESGGYLRGLLVLIGKDRTVADQEVHLMKHAGETLGYCPKFCADAIGEILENRHILHAPPEFASRELAEMFVRDGLALAAVDDQVHPAEERWLASAAEMNGLSQAWYRQELARSLSGERQPSRLEVDGLAVEY